MSETRKRYQLREGSQTDHCCFAWTVVDMTKPGTDFSGNQITDSNNRPLFEEVCECLELEDAKLIRNALNEAKGGGR